MNRAKSKARDVAFENGVAHVPAPHGQALALALLEVAPTHDGPARVAGKHPPARLARFADLDDQVEACRRVFCGIVDHRLFARTFGSSKDLNLENSLVGA